MYNVLVPNPDNKHVQKCHTPCKLDPNQMFSLPFPFHFQTYSFSFKNWFMVSRDVFDPNQMFSLPFPLSNVLLLLQKLVYGVQGRIRPKSNVLTSLSTFKRTPSPSKTGLWCPGTYS